MKIITDNAAYIQNSDIMQIMAFENVIPGEFMNEMFNGGYVYINDSNYYAFKKFEGPQTIEFINGLDWIVDYGEVKDMPEEDIANMCCLLADEYNGIAEKYNNLTPHQRKLNHSLSTECDKKEYKINALKEFVMFRRGVIPMEIPDEFDLPESYGIKPEERKSIVKRVRSLFNKNKKNQ